MLLTSFIAYINLHVKCLENGIGLFGSLFNVTTFTQSFNIFIFLISGVILTLTAFFPRKIYLKKYYSLYNLVFKKLVYNKSLISNKTGEQFRIIEYSLIIVFALCGAVFLMSSADLISVFLSIELQSYGLYILSTIYRDSESATASGLTYFLLGGLSSCFILLGSALLYANSGTTNLDNIYIISSITDINNMQSVMYIYESHYLHLSLIILCIGFLFKVSAAPFHFWSPDVYDGIPTIVTTYVAIVAKISIFAFFLELVYFTQQNYFNFSWNSIFALSSILSLIIGSVLGLTQFRIKRLLAYSTISHVGFILFALCINSTESIQSYIFYILQYTLSNLNAFIILLTIGYTLYIYVNKDKENEINSEKNKINKTEKNEINIEKKELTDQNNSPIQLTNQIKGYFYINPFISISLAITLFSFVGIPPIIGFFAKQMILSAALDSGYVFMSLIAILTSVIGAAYYLNLIKQIFFFKHEYKINPVLNNLNLSAYWLDFKKVTSLNNILYKPENITINSSLSTSISIITLLLVLFIYVPNEWFNIVSILTLIIFKS